MNDLIQNNLFLIIIFLLLIILTLIGVLVFVIFKLLTNQNQNQKTNTEPPPAPVEDFREIALKKLKEKKPTEVSEKFYCHNHKETASVGSCLICEDVFCEKCLIEHEGLYFCREHFKIFANHKWTTITDVKTTPDNPEDGLYVWDFKRYLWKEKLLPTFVLTHYKINVENDYIESYVQLNVIDKDADELKIEIEKFKQ